jgi:hypothetical protein
MAIGVQLSAALPSWDWAFWNGSFLKTLHLDLASSTAAPKERF